MIRRPPPFSPAHWDGKRERKVSTVLHFQFAFSAVQGKKGKKKRGKRKKEKRPNLSLESYPTSMAN